MNFKRIGNLLASLFLLGTMFAVAQTPDFVKVTDKMYGGSLEKLSDNGKWAVGYGQSPHDELAFSYPRLYDVKNKKMTYLFSAQEVNTVTEMRACDVTDDGKIVVGQYDGKPAFWNADTKKWTILPNKLSGLPHGSATCVTPDGKYALGTIDEGTGSFIETIRLWDLSGATPADITPNNIPEPISMFGQMQNIQQIRACDLAPDGSSFTGIVAFSYVEEVWCFVYNMKTKTWKGIGYDVEENGRNKYKFTKTGESYFFISDGLLANDGKKIFGNAYLESNTDAIYEYDVETGKITIVDGSEGMSVGAVDNNGIIYSWNPASGLLRNVFAKVGKYWYDARLVFSQIWGIDWAAQVSQDEYGYSGTCISVSKDGKTILSNEYSNSPYDSYVMQLPKSIEEVAPEVNLLGNYYLTPVNNSAFAVLSEVRVTFDRNIEVTGKYNDAKLVDEGGNTVANSINVSVDPGDSRVLCVTFRNRRLEVGKKYQVVIPKNICHISGDKEKTNDEIVVSYKGRPDAPVAPLTVSPASGTQISRINSTSNPVTVTFDAEISNVEKGGKIVLYRINDTNDREFICNLNGSISGNVLMIFPVMEQRLAKGSDYEIVVEANVVSDISGSDPNQEYVIKYSGSYVPDSSVGSVLFSDDFNGGVNTNNWMLLDGDDLEPADTPAGWGFYQGLPWWVGRDSQTDTDMYAMSHSMYKNPGQSDDWMVTNQIFINDDSAVLSFKSQGYLKNKQDRLKVYILEDPDVYTSLTESVLQKLRYKSDLVYDEIQSPGANEELTAGEWTENNIKLDKYAGKYIYIAFLNDNRNQSAVFVEDVVVSRDVKFSLINLTPTSGLNSKEIKVKGIFGVESQTDTYKGYSLVLRDGDGKEIDRIADPDIELSKGWSTEFTFDKAIPTPVGKVLDYTIDVTLGDLNEKVVANYQNLAVKTNKKVVIEKYTGQNCPNCPLGIIAHDILERDFPGQILTLAYHCYPGDNLSTPQASKMNEFLGMNAAPTGRINRGPIAGPIWRDSETYKHYYNNNGTWYDYVAEEMNELAPADVVIERVKFEDNTYVVKMNVKYALDMDNQNVNVLAVVTENKLNGYQDNNLYTYQDDLLGDWGSEGKYASATVPYVYNDVVRTWEGTSFNGTGGYIPSSVTAGVPYEAEIRIPNISRIQNPENTRVTVMLIDSETGRIINAERMNTNGDLGVSDMTQDVKEASVSVIGNEINVNCNGYAEAMVFGLDGRVIASGNGYDSFSVEAGSYNGVAVVIVKSEAGVKSFKVFVK